MDVLNEQLIQVTKNIEKQVDATIEQIDNLDSQDLAALRKHRIKELQKEEEQKKIWLMNGHKEYEELPEEKSFFDVLKKSDNVVIHFYTNTSERCKILDMHLKILAPKHIETKFVKLNAEKCPFLAERLKIKVIPTIVLISKSIMVDRIVGFTDLGNTDEFTTETLEWRIAQNDIIKYEGDLSTPPYLQEKCKKQNNGRKIRDGMYNKDDGDLDIEEYGLTKEMSKDNKVESVHLSPELTADELAELGLE